MVAPISSALDRLLDPVADCFTRESAERLVGLQIDSATRSRIDELARKANEGELTESERVEYHDYIEAMDLIAILQSKARQILVRTS
jgi:hypothetical protein